MSACGSDRRTASRGAASCDMVRRFGEWPMVPLVDLPYNRPVNCRLNCCHQGTIVPVLHL